MLVFLSLFNTFSHRNDDPLDLDYAHFGDAGQILFKTLI